MLSPAPAPKEGRSWGCPPLPPPLPPPPPPPPTPPYLPFSSPPPQLPLLTRLVRRWGGQWGEQEEQKEGQKEEQKAGRTGVSTPLTEGWKTHWPRNMWSPSPCLLWHHSARHCHRSDCHDQHDKDYHHDHNCILYSTGPVLAVLVLRMGIWSHPLKFSSNIGGLDETLSCWPQVSMMFQ